MKINTSEQKKYYLVTRLEDGYHYQFRDKFVFIPNNQETPLNVIARLRYKIQPLDQDELFKSELGLKCRKEIEEQYNLDKIEKELMIVKDQIEEFKENNYEKF